MGGLAVTGGGRQNNGISSGGLVLGSGEGATGVGYNALGPSSSSSSGGGGGSVGGSCDNRSVTAPLTFGQQQRLRGGDNHGQQQQQQLSGAATPNAVGRRSMGGTIPPGAAKGASTLGHPG